MRIAERRPIVVALLAVVVASGAAWATNNPNGSAFRAVGFFQGKSSISAGEITCEIPTISSAIGDGAFAMGLWNTFGIPTLHFPDLNSPVGNPCGGWIELQNNLLDQAIALDHINLRYRIPRARRFRQYVPSKKGFPRACKKFRRAKLFVGGVLQPSNSSSDNAPSGAPNVTFIQLIPLISGQVISCLRDQYASLPADLYTSLPLQVNVKAIARSDSGDTFIANAIKYTLDLRHSCGNGRLDDFEICDPNAPSTCVGFCKIDSGAAFGTCSHNLDLSCRSDSDCLGVCLDGNTPTECVCVY